MCLPSHPTALSLVRTLWVQAPRAYNNARPRPLPIPRHRVILQREFSDSSWSPEPLHSHLTAMNRCSWCCTLPTVIHVAFSHHEDLNKWTPWPKVPQHLRELRSEQGRLQLAESFHLVLAHQWKDEFQSENSPPRSFCLSAAPDCLGGPERQIWNTLSWRETEGHCPESQESVGGRRQRAQADR